MKQLIYAFICIALLVSCNREKRYSRKLMKGETWEVVSITADGQETPLAGSKWLVTSDVDIYDSVPRVMWTSNGEDAVFEWQFRDKGKQFILSYYQLCEECEGVDMDALDYAAYDLTGTYSVERHGRNKMEFKSNTTIGYPDKEVVIVIER